MNRKGLEATMNDREALAAEVEADLRACTWRELLASATVLQVAARERLAQLPEKCGTCIATPGTVDVIDEFADCPTCHGSGKVYPAELVERIARIFDPISVIPKIWAVAVLDALNGEAE